MAESKYLDKGGVEYLWEKIKSFFIDDYLLNVYGTGASGSSLNFGAISGTGKPYIQISSDRIIIANNSSTAKVIDIQNESMTIRSGQAPALEIDNSDVVFESSDVEISGNNAITIFDESTVNLRSAKIYLDNVESNFYITEYRGIALIYSPNNAEVYLRNQTGRALKMCRVGGTSITNNQISVGGYLKTNANIVTLLFWHSLT